MDASNTQRCLLGIVVSALLLKIISATTASMVDPSFTIHTDTHTSQLATESIQSLSVSTSQPPQSGMISSETHLDDNTSIRAANSAFSIQTTVSTTDDMGGSQSRSVAMNSFSEEQTSQASDGTSESAVVKSETIESATATAIMSPSNTATVDVPSSSGQITVLTSNAVEPLGTSSTMLNVFVSSYQPVLSSIAPTASSDIETSSSQIRSSIANTQTSGSALGSPIPSLMSEDSTDLNPSIDFPDSSSKFLSSSSPYVTPNPSDRSASNVLSSLSSSGDESILDTVFTLLLSSQTSSDMSSSSTIIRSMPPTPMSSYNSVTSLNDVTSIITHSDNQTIKEDGHTTLLDDDSSIASLISATETINPALVEASTITDTTPSDAPMPSSITFSNFTTLSSYHTGTEVSVTNTASGDVMNTIISSEVSSEFDIDLHPSETAHTIPLTQNPALTTSTPTSMSDDNSEDISETYLWISSEQSDVTPSIPLDTSSRSSEDNVQSDVTPSISLDTSSRSSEDNVQSDVTPSISLDTSSRSSEDNEHTPSTSIIDDTLISFHSQYSTIDVSLPTSDSMSTVPLSALMDVSQLLNSDYGEDSTSFTSSSSIYGTPSLSPSSVPDTDIESGTVLFSQIPSVLSPTSVSPDMAMSVLNTDSLSVTNMSQNMYSITEIDTSMSTLLTTDISLLSTSGIGLDASHSGVITSSPGYSASIGGFNWTHQNTTDANVPTVPTTPPHAFPDDYLSLKLTLQGDCTLIKNNRSNFDRLNMALLSAFKTVINATIQIDNVKIDSLICHPFTVIVHLDRKFSKIFEARLTTLHFPLDLRNVTHIVITDGNGVPVKILKIQRQMMYASGSYSLSDTIIITLGATISGVLIIMGAIVFVYEMFWKKQFKALSFTRRVRNETGSVALTGLPRLSMTEMKDNGSLSGNHQSLDETYSSLENQNEKQTSFMKSSDLRRASGRGSGRLRSSLSKKAKSLMKKTKAPSPNTDGKPLVPTNGSVHGKGQFGLVVGLMGFNSRAETDHYAVPFKRSKKNKDNVYGLAIRNTSSMTRENANGGGPGDANSNQSRALPLPPRRYLKRSVKAGETTDSSENLVHRKQDTKTQGDGGLYNPSFVSDTSKSRYDSKNSLHL